MRVAADGYAATDLDPVKASAAPDDHGSHLWLLPGRIEVLAAALIAATLSGTVRSLISADDQEASGGPIAGQPFVARVH
jgi:hypothetical protein